MAGIGEPKVVELVNEGRAWVSNDQCIHLEQPGVYFVKQDSRWRAYVRRGGRRYDLGEYETQVSAVHAYNLGYHQVCGTRPARGYREFSKVLTHAEKCRVAKKVTRRLEVVRQREEFNSFLGCL